MAVKRRGIQGLLSGKIPSGKKVKLKRDNLADLAAAISGKDNFASVLRLDDEDVVGTVRGIVSTRSIAIDAATNIGGLPRGRLTEIFGQETSGKSTLVQHLMAQVQAAGGTAALYEPEVKMAKNYAAVCGVDLKRVLVIEPHLKKDKSGDVLFSGERTLEAGVEASRRTFDHWLAQGLQEELLGLFIDSIGGAATEEEIANPNTAQPGVAARVLKRAMRQLCGKCARSGALWVLVNQQYEKIGGFSRGPGVRRSTYGGSGIRYHASLRLELIYTGQLKDTQGNVVGIECLCKVFKNSLAAPREESFAVEWGKGINNAWSLLEKLKAHKYIVSGGGWNTFQVQGGEPVQWQGSWKGLTDLLVANPPLMAQMAAVYNALPAGG